LWNLNYLTLLKKSHILCQFCFEIFFVDNTYKFCYKKNCRKLLPIFLQNILYKILLTTNFVWTTYEFYNFIENNYPQKNYLLIKILIKNSKKRYFLVICFNKFAKKISHNIRIFSSANTTTPLHEINWI